MPRTSATLIGIVALAFWAALALLTRRAQGIPPFELLALNGAVAFAAGLIHLARRRRLALLLPGRLWRPWLIAVAAIFLYHALYFHALATVPAAQASLIANFWPLLIVIFAAMGSGARLQIRHLAGAGLGLMGVGLVFAGRAEPAATGPAPLGGYLAAAACAVIWAAYSVSNRRFAAVPSDMLVGVCGAVALLSALAHLAVEPSVAPTARQWSAILALGLGPLGLAFLAWDHATKHGNLPLLGALSYLTPLASTLLLVLAHEAPASPALALAAVLIVTGALVAARPRRASIG